MSTPDQMRRRSPRAFRRGRPEAQSLTGGRAALQGRLGIRSSPRFSAGGSASPFLISTRQVSGHEFTHAVRNPPVANAPTKPAAPRQGRPEAQRRRFQSRRDATTRSRYATLPPTRAVFACRCGSPWIALYQGKGFSRAVTNTKRNFLALRAGAPAQRSAMTLRHSVLFSRFSAKNRCKSGPLAKQHERADD
jgi:hypothetical protein